MTTSNAALLLSWICLIFLTFSMAGLLSQLKDLKAEVSTFSLGGRSTVVGRAFPALARNDKLSVTIVVDPECSRCEPLLVELAQHCHTDTPPDMQALSYQSKAQWQIYSGFLLIDKVLFKELDLPWLPAALVVDSDGEILSVAPVDSFSSLKRSLGAPNPMSAATAAAEDNKKLKGKRYGNAKHYS